MEYIKKGIASITLTGSASPIIAKLEHGSNTICTNTTLYRNCELTIYEKRRRFLRNIFHKEQVANAEYFRAWKEIIALSDALYRRESLYKKSFAKYYHASRINTIKEKINSPTLINGVALAELENELAENEMVIPRVEEESKIQRLHEMPWENNWHMDRERDIMDNLLNNRPIVIYERGKKCYGGTMNVVISDHPELPPMKIRYKIIIEDDNIATVATLMIDSSGKTHFACVYEDATTFLEDEEENKFNARFNTNMFNALMQLVSMNV